MPKRLNAISLAAALLLAVAPAAEAQATTAAGAPNWKQIFDDGQSIVYLDQNSIQPNADQAGHPNAVEVAELDNYKVSQVYGDYQITSIETVAEISCGEKLIMNRSKTYYSFEMGSGPIKLPSDVASNWRPIAPGSTEEAVWNAVCAKK